MNSMLKKLLTKYRNVSLLMTIFCIAGLIGCGEDETPSTQQDTYFVSVSVSGLEAEGLSLHLHSGEQEVVEITVDENGSFTFPGQLPDGTSYEVYADEVPSEHTCTINNATGTIDGEDVTDIGIQCEGPNARLEPAHFTVNIDSAASTLSVGQGEPIIVVADIENTGDETVSQDITLTIDGELEVTVSDFMLEGGESQPATLEWNTAFSEHGSFTAVVASDDDSDSVSLGVNPPSGLPYYTVSLNESGSTLEAEVGETIVVAADILNLGDTAGSQDIVLEAGGDILATVPGVELNSGVSTTVLLEWAPELEDIGSYSAAVNSDNDSAAVNFEVFPEVLPPYFSVEIDEAQSVLNMEVGGTISIDVDVENTGDESDTQDIVLEIDGDIKATRSDLELAGGTSESVTLEWDTVSGEAGNYIAHIRSDDDADMVSVSVAPHAGTAHFAVSIDESASVLEVNEEESVVVEIFVENIGDVTATQDITLEIGGFFEDMEIDVEIDGGNSTTIILEWETAAGEAGNYIAEASSDEETATAEVTVIDPDALYSVTGVVTDAEADGADFEGVHILLFEAGTDDFVSDSTIGVDGIYEISDIAPGSYDLGLQAAGLEPNYEISEASGANRIEVALSTVDVVQDLTIDWMSSTDLMIDGGLFDFQYGDPNGELAVPLPGCERQPDDTWEPEEVDAGDDSIEVTLDPDDQCFHIKDVAIDLVTGELTIDIADIIFPNVTVFLDDEDDNFDELVDSVEIDFDWLLDHVDGEVDFVTGSMDLDIDLRIMVGGTVTADTGFLGIQEFDFGSREDEYDCQLTRAWGGGDLDAPVADTDNLQEGDYLHDPIELRLTTEQSGPNGLFGNPYNSNQGLWVTIDNMMEIGQLSEGRFGSDHQGGASCGELDLFGFVEEDFATILNDLLELPAGQGSVYGEFHFVAP